MMVFANRATSDEWWRAVTDSVAAGCPDFAGVKRISPQFYTYGGNITTTVRDQRCAAKFVGRVFFTRLNYENMPLAISVAPVLNYVDHISGNG